jgi:hypothetical protein
MTIEANELQINKESVEEPITVFLLLYNFLASVWNVVLIAACFVS